MSEVIMLILAIVFLFTREKLASSGNLFTYSIVYQVLRIAFYLVAICYALWWGFHYLQFFKVEFNNQVENFI